MLVIIPSYKRTEILPSVIESVIRSEISKIEERIKIIIVNNYPENKIKINNIVSRYSENKKFECVAHNRIKTLPALVSWFSAIHEYAIQDEVIMLLGDDDLMLPWGLQVRYETIISNKSDMLLTDFTHHIYFFEKGRRYWLTNDLPTEDEVLTTPNNWNFIPEKHPEASFISNHCYRYTENFKRAVNLTFEWANKQYWLAEDMRTGMIPFYLPYALKLTKGKVISLEKKCVIRGAMADELINSDYSNGGNRMFYDLCALNVFKNLYKNTENKSFLSVCKYFENGVITGFFTILSDKKITNKDIFQTMKNSNFEYIKLINTKILYGLIILLIQILGLRGIRLRLRRLFKMHNPIEEMFKKYNK
jgi:hypothetical protein